ncbi:MAG TPA: hypothetical protein VG225_15060, partial [Terracidiphilus sp.]|nr:hypothetical protein [Terracidiphilus sp.]
AAGEGWATEQACAAPFDYAQNSLEVMPGYEASDALLLFSDGGRRRNAGPSAAADEGPGAPSHWFGTIIGTGATCPV